MKITHKTSAQLIVQNSFTETYGILLTSIIFLILGLVIFYSPQISQNSEQKQEIFISLTSMGAILFLTWAIKGDTTWVFDKDDSYLVVTTSYLFVFKILCKYSLTEINEVRLESIIDDRNPTQIEQCLFFGCPISENDPNRSHISGFVGVGLCDQYDLTP